MVSRGRPSGNPRITRGRGFGHLEGGRLAMNAAGDVFLNGTLTGPVDLGGGPFGAGGTTLLGSLDPAGGFALGGG
jgi:hypothetical protein